MKEFDGLDAQIGMHFDNVYTDVKEQKKMVNYSEMGSQCQPSDIQGALQRKGGDLLTPGLDKDDFSKKKQQKKKRGRKNKYIAAIDAEDDEEADKMSEGSDDGLDHIKEEDEEDEEEKLAKLAKLRDLEDQARRKAEDDEWRKLLKKKYEIDQLLKGAQKGNQSLTKQLGEKEN